MGRTKMERTTEIAYLSSPPSDPAASPPAALQVQGAKGKQNPRGESMKENTPQAFLGTVVDILACWENETFWRRGGGRK